MRKKEQTQHAENRKEPRNARYGKIKVIKLHTIIIISPLPKVNALQKYPHFTDLAHLCILRALKRFISHPFKLDM